MADYRYRLALFRSWLRTVMVVAGGVVFFLAWDFVGIATGSFYRGQSPAYLGIGLSANLPLEEVVFLSFLCYLTLVIFAAAARIGKPR